MQQHILLYDPRILKVMDVSVLEGLWEYLDVEEMKVLWGMLVDLLLQRNWNVAASKAKGWSNEIGEAKARKDWSSIQKEDVWINLYYSRVGRMISNRKCLLDLFWRISGFLLMS